MPGLLHCCTALLHSCAGLLHCCTALLHCCAVRALDVRARHRATVRLAENASRLRRAGSRFAMTPRLALRPRMSKRVIDWRRATLLRSGTTRLLRCWHPARRLVVLESPADDSRRVAAKRSRRLERPRECARAPWSLERADTPTLPRCRALTQVQQFTQRRTSHRLRDRRRWS